MKTVLPDPLRFLVELALTYRQSNGRTLSNKKIYLPPQLEGIVIEAISGIGTEPITGPSLPWALEAGPTLAQAYHQCTLSQMHHKVCLGALPMGPAKAHIGPAATLSMCSAIWWSLRPTCCREVSGKRDR